MASIEKAGIPKFIDDAVHTVQGTLSDRLHKWFGNRSETVQKAEGVVQAGVGMVGDMANPARAFGVTSALQGGAGKAIKAFHGGSGRSLDSFNPKGVGMHFGTKEQAKFVSAVKGKKAIREVELDIKNPVRLEDRNAWGPTAVLGQLKEKGIVTADEFDKLTNIDFSFNINKVLKDKGYDGIVYANKAEGIGDSFITLSNKQVKEVGTGEVLSTARKATIRDYADISVKEKKKFDDILAGVADDSAKKIEVAGKTQTNREVASLPVRDIVKKGDLVDGDVLYIGAGKDFTGGQLLGKDGRKVTMTDPNIPKGAPKDFLAKPPEGAKYDNVVSVFTAQTLEPAIRKGFFDEIRSHMKPGGQALVAVRGTGGGINGVRHLDGAINLSKGTFQKPYTGATLAEELGSHGFNVEIIQGARGANPSTVMAKLTIGD